MHKIVRFWRLPRAEKGLLVETLVLLAVARMALKLLPFRWAARLLGKQETQAPVQESPAHAQEVRRVRAMVRRASRHVPWTSECLERAMAGRIMLARRGISGTVYFGVRHGD